jgi:hypothetical protein
MTYVLFAIWSLACFGAGAAAIIGLGMMIDKRRRQAADPLAEYETVAAPEHAPSRN